MVLLVESLNTLNIHGKYCLYNKYKSTYLRSKFIHTYMTSHLLSTCFHSKPVIEKVLLPKSTTSFHAIKAHVKHNKNESHMHSLYTALNVAPFGLKNSQRERKTEHNTNPIVLASSRLMVCEDSVRRTWNMEHAKHDAMQYLRLRLFPFIPIPLLLDEGV